MYSNQRLTLNTLHKRKQMITESIIENENLNKIEQFGDYDNNLRLETFRKRDYNRVLNEAKSIFHNIGKMIGVKTSAKIEAETRTHTHINKSQIDKLTYVIKNGNKVEEHTTLIPTIYKNNYFVSSGLHYLMGLYLEMMPINIFDKSGVKRIMLSPIDSITVNLKKSRNKDDVVLVSFMNLNIELSEFIADMKTIDSQETSDKYLTSAGFNIDSIKVPFDFREYFETCVFTKYYKELLYSHIAIIEAENNVSVKSFEEFDTFELIEYAVATIGFQKISYIDLNHRRIVMGEVIFRDLFWFNRNFVLSFYNSNVLQFKQKTFYLKYLYDSFPLTISTPINYNLYKISQVKRDDSEDKSKNLKIEWMEYHPSHLKVICPISVSAGHMAKTLYLTQGINIDCKGKLIPTKKSKLLSPQASKSSLITSGTISARTQMAQKYFTQAVYSPNCTKPYTGSFDNFKDEISLYNEVAKKDGKVIDSTRSLLKVEYDDGEINILTIESWKTTDGVNGVILEDVMKKGDKFKKGDIIIKYHDPEKFAYRMDKIAFLPFFGYSAEDAIAISEKESKRMISTYSKKIHIPITQFTELQTIPEIGQVLQDDVVCTYSYKSISSTFLGDGVVTSIKYDKIKNIPIDDFMTKIIVDKLVTDIRDEFKDSTFTEEEICEYHSYISTPPDLVHAGDLDNPTGKTHKEMILEAKAINQKLQPKSKSMLTSKSFIRTINPDELIGVISIEITTSKISGVGDKFTTSFTASKGVTSKIIPDAICPTTKDGTPISAFFNPFGFFRRNNWSMVFDGFIGNMIEDIESNSTQDEQIRKITFLRDEIMALSKNSSQYDLFTDDYIKRLVKTYNGSRYWLMVNLESVDNINFDIMDNIVDNYDIMFNTSISQLQEIIIQPETLQWLKTQGFNVGYLDITKPLTVKCQILAGSALKLNQVSGHKFNSADHNVSRNKENGQLHKGRSNQGATSVSWMTLSAILSSNFSEESNPKPELFDLFYLKSDASIQEKYNFNSAVLAKGRNVNIIEMMNNHKPQSSEPMKFFGANLALTGLEIASGL